MQHRTPSFARTHLSQRAPASSSLLALLLVTGLASTACGDDGSVLGSESSAGSSGQARGGHAGDASSAGSVSSTGSVGIAGTQASAGVNGGGMISSGGTTTGGASNADQTKCETDFDALDRTCTNAEDCVLVDHQIDCCGTPLRMGLARSEQVAFDALEQHCSAKFPPCGCAAQGVKLEDGSFIDFGSDAARLDCVDRRCRSRNSNETTACGDKSCTADQYCYESVDGPASPDSQPSYSCISLGGCQDCGCLSVGGSCQCSGFGGAIKVFCALP